LLYDLGVRALAGFSVVALCAGPAAADESDRVGFVNGARNAVAASAEIDRLRSGVISAIGMRDLGEGTMRVALEAPLADIPDASESVDRARTLYQEARRAFEAFDEPAALASLADAEAALVSLSPTDESTAALADIAVLVGLVHWQRNDRKTAAEEFRIAARLDPSRTELDPGEYRPKLVAAYRNALRSERLRATLTVTLEPADARLWVDGRPVDTSSVAVGVGVHYVAAGLDGYAPVGARVTVGDRGGAASLVLARAVGEARVRGLRARLSRSEADWREAAREIAAITGVAVLVLVREMESGELVAAGYDARADTMGPWSPLAEGNWIATLPGAGHADPPPAPMAKRPELVPSAPPARGSPSAKPWYRTWWGVSLVTSGAVVVGTTVYFATRDDPAPVYRITDFCLDAACE
jgi:hypothetical protein